MTIALRDAVAADSGGKAAGLGRLLKAGLPVPDGFVIPFETIRTADGKLSAELKRALSDGLTRLGDGTVAVRSSADSEDTTNWSGAGQYDTVLGVRGVDAVLEAVSSCWVSVAAPRAASYWSLTGGGLASPLIAVIVQQFVAADISGVMFTPAGPQDPTLIEASWGLGPSVVGGTVTPDSYRVAADGTVSRVVADKRTRIDASNGELATRAVSDSARTRCSLDDAELGRLAAIGAQIADLFQAPQDVEWAISDGQLHVLQSRPITAAVLCAAASGSIASGSTPSSLHGTPGSSGSATGTARVVRGPGDFSRVHPGDILICPFTDPAWVPLLHLAAGVVTATGGMLSHAAIVARELRIPAVLGCADVMTAIPDGSAITINGTTGTITTP